MEIDFTLGGEVDNGFWEGVDVGEYGEGDKDTEAEDVGKASRYQPPL